MTCIVGIADGGGVWIGGDAMTHTGCQYDIRSNPKVVRVGDIIIGVSGMPRVNDLVRYTLKVKDCGDDVLRWAVLDFVPALRAMLEAGGVSIEPGKDQHEWAMLVGVRDRLFSVYDDFQVEETICGYAAIGCAEKAALGSLYSTKSLAPVTRVRIALEAAAMVDVHVGGPFTIEGTGSS